MLFYIILVLLTLVFVYSKRNHNYWKRRNVSYDTPLPFMGNHLRTLCALKNITQVSLELYNKYSDEPLIGYFRCNTPELIVKDPNIIRHILNVDFNNFYARGIKVSVQTNLFEVDGDTWRLLRQRLSSAFTIGKLKKMFPLICHCTNKLKEATRNHIEMARNETVELNVKELMARFTTDFIGACGFGIDMDSISNDKSDFRRLGKNIFHFDLRFITLMALKEIFPEIFRDVKMYQQGVFDVVIKLLKSVREQRNFEPSNRNDFIDLLIGIERQGTMRGESIEIETEDGLPVLVEKEIDIELMAAQVFIFFAAGFETSSFASSYTLYQLAHNPDIQRKVQDEIDVVMNKYGNNLTYESLSEMRYLSMVFKEAMRLAPSLGVLNRVCTKPYTLPGTDISIDKGVRILIPVLAIHLDAKYYDNPSEFRPERFSEEAIKTRSKYVYLPFGEGPRACIGMKLGNTQSLAGLAAILHKFCFEPGSTPYPNAPVDPKSNVVQNYGDIYLNVKERQPCQVK